MPSSRARWTRTPDFHPEFGRLCPSPSRHRGTRLAMVSVVAVLAIGATMGLAVAHWPDGAARDGVSAPPKQSLSDGSGVSASPAEPSVSAVSAGASAFSRAQESCRGDEAGVIGALAATFLDSTCGAAKIHARHAARATNRVATVIIGRKDAPPEPAAPTATAALEPSAIAARGAEKSDASMTPPVERPAPYRKKVRAKTDASFAYASVSRSGRDYYDPYGTRRYVAPQSSFDRRFGQSW